jgi:P27 family predicted phage terminase small subunit
MGARGPRPDGAIDGASGNTKQTKQIKPPDGMTTRARKLFREIVAGNTVKNMDSEAVALIQTFCDAYDHHCQAMERLGAEGLVVTENTKYGTVTKKNEWFNIHKESVSMMTSVSTKLRHKGVAVATKTTSRSGLMFGRA